MLQKECYRHSPGRFRQLERFRWTWDFEESKVKDGHDCVSSQDREISRMKQAKLTFGEVLDSGVGRMLYNLGASQKRKFHDLGMGPGKMLFQTFLSFPNLTTCMGVESCEGRYLLAEKNMRKLASVGWRGRGFLIVEEGPGFMKIAETTPHQRPKNGFLPGDRVVAYNKKIKRTKEKMVDYEAVVVKVYDGNRVVVKYDGFDLCATVDSRMVFVPGTQRTCEIWFGSLFDYPGGWDADICILETDFPKECHEELVDGMCKTPLGCTFLTYHDLKKFDCFPHAELRQMDVNVYDTDRYLTSWSQGWRFYLWEHVNDPLRLQPLPTNVTAADLVLEERVRVYSTSQRQWGWAKCHPLLEDEKSVKVEWEASKKRETVPLGQRLALHRPRFTKGQRVFSFHPDWLESKSFQLFPGTVERYQPDGGVTVAMEHLEHTVTVRPQHCFAPPVLRYRVGQKVLCCWTQFAMNKNSPERYRKFPAEIKSVEEGLYVVDFDFGDSREESDCVREMWITSREEDRAMEARRALINRKISSDPRLSLCIQTAHHWTPLCVSTLLVECSSDAALPERYRKDYRGYRKTVWEKRIDGRALLAMGKDDLIETLGFAEHEAKFFVGRYLSWINSRADKQPKRKSREKAAPGGGLGVLEKRRTRRRRRSPSPPVLMRVDPSDEKEALL